MPPSQVESHSRGPGHLSCSSDPQECTTQPPPKWAGKTIQTKAQKPVLWWLSCFPQHPNTSQPAGSSPAPANSSILARSLVLLPTTLWVGGKLAWPSSTSRPSVLLVPLWESPPCRPLWSPPPCQALAEFSFPRKAVLQNPIWSRSSLIFPRVAQHLFLCGMHHGLRLCNCLCAYLSSLRLLGWAHKERAQAEYSTGFQTPAETDSNGMAKWYKDYRHMGHCSSLLPSKEGLIKMIGIKIN